MVKKHADVHVQRFLLLGLGEGLGVGEWSDGDVGKRLGKAQHRTTCSYKL